MLFGCRSWLVSGRLDAGRCWSVGWLVAGHAVDCCSVCFSACWPVCLPTPVSNSLMHYGGQASAQKLQSAGVQRQWGDHVISCLPPNLLHHFSEKQCTSTHLPSTYVACGQALCCLKMWDNRRLLTVTWPHTLNCSLYSVLHKGMPERN